MAALLVAALVPLLAAFATTAVLVPRAAADAQRARLEPAAVEASRALARACGTLGDRAALLATQLQLGGGDVSAGGARRAVRTAGSATRDAAAGLAVYDSAGDRLAVAGGGGTALPDDLSGPAPSCSRGDGVLGDQLVESVTTAVGSSADVRAVASVAVADVVAPVGTEPVTVIVVGTGTDPAVVATAGAGVDAETAARVLDRITATAARQPVDGGQPGDPMQVGEAGDLSYVSGPRVGDLTTVAFARRPGVLWWVVLPSAAAFVVAVAALAVLLARTLARPVTRLSRLARDVGGDGTPLEGHDELDVVAERLGDLVGGLRSAEDDVARSRAALVASFGRFGSALDRIPDLAGFLRSVGEAAMLAVDAHLAVVSVTAPERAADPLPRTDTPAESAPGRARVLSVTLFSPTGGRGAPPVLLDGGADEAALADPADLDALRHGIAQLRDTPAEDTPAGDTPTDPRAGDTTSSQGWSALLPMRQRGTAVGHIGVVRRPGHGPPDHASLAALSALVANATIALANVSRHQETALLSVTDPLTGVGNVRHLSATLIREVERAVRFGHNLAVLMVDLDHFKQINDTHGHPRGDEVLVEVARRLAGCVREVDTLARYGGEEFCLLLPETDIDGAAVLAERLVAAVAAEAFTTGGAPDVHLTISVGIAAHPVHGRSGAEVMRVADSALYQAKRAGRNRVVAAAVPPGWSPPPPSAPPPDAPDGPGGGPPGAAEDPAPAAAPAKAGRAGKARPGKGRQSARVPRATG